MKRSALAALLCGLCLPASAHAAVPPGTRVSVGVDPATVQLGSRVAVSGRVAAAGVVQPGVRVTLYAQRFPYRHSFGRVASRRTNPRGTYAFRHAFDRNTRLRVKVSGAPTSRVVEADVVPRTSLLDRLSHDGRHLRATVNARSPRDVRLRGRADIYVGRYGARHLRKVSRPVMRRVHRGLFRASVLLTLPASFNGGYRIVSCYAAPSRSGMRERGFHCPRVASYSSAAGASVSTYRP